ncbi:hypothetical protein HWV62_11089 [Athelia sp. TMB]|nr:hypothetical protein HWV62_11089 [Athelia sp. TMB]
MTPHFVCPDCGVDGIEKNHHHIDFSPVHSYLGNNLPPSTHEQLEKAQRALEQLQNHIIVVDEVLSRGTFTCNCPQARRSALQDYANAHRAFISPLRRLPSELLGEIFHWVVCLPPPFGYPARRASLLGPAPLLLERVCRHWREVARASPALWSYIEVGLEDGNEEHDLAFTSNFLARSAAHPLSIVLGKGYKVPDPEHPALALLVAKCERWQTLDLRVPFSTIRALASRVKGKLSMLRSLEISRGDQFRGNDYTIPIDTFAVAPLLRHFDAGTRLRHDPVGSLVATRTIILPWNGLTSLEFSIREREAIDVWTVLQGCTRLMKLKCYIGSNVEGQWESHNKPILDGRLLPSIELPRLRSLELALSESHFIFMTLTLPVLDELLLKINRPISSHDSPLDMNDKKLWHIRSGFDASMLRSRCILSELQLTFNDGTSFGAQGLVGCLTKLPSLTRFTVCGNFITILLSMLTLDDPNTPLTPRLRTLGITALTEALPRARLTSNQTDMLHSFILSIDEEELATVPFAHLLYLKNVLKPRVSAMARARNVSAAVPWRNIPFN